MKTILIIEDDPAIRDELAFLLGNEGYRALAVTDFNRIAEQVAARQADLILLDLGLPGKDGFALCAEIKKNTNIPIIFVTSHNSAMDELQALNLGGDDYITKPYHIPVLLAHIRAVLRRSGGQEKENSDMLCVNGLELCLSKGIASAGEQTVELTRNELRILAYLMGRPGVIVSRDELMEALWSSHIYIDDNTLSVNMTRIRAKLDGLGLPGFIRTRRGMGYQI